MPEALAAAVGRPAPAGGWLRAHFDEAIAPRADPAEIAWYAARLPRDAGVVLQPMAGHGRLLIPLSEAGYALHGVDASAACLARCRAGVEAAGHVVELFRQDTGSLNLPFRYAAAFFADRAFQRLHDRRRALDTLLRIHAHLVDPGLLLIDFFIPAEAAHPPGAPVVEFRMVKLSDGTQIARRSEAVVETAARRSTVRSRFERRCGTQVMAREDETCCLTWYAERQIAEIVADAGFHDIRCEDMPSFPPVDAAPGRRFAVLARA